MRCSWKGWELYVVQVTSDLKVNKYQMEDLSILIQFRDVFPEEILRLPPRRDWFLNWIVTKIDTNFKRSISNENTRANKIEIVIKGNVGHGISQT